MVQSTNGLTFIYDFTGVAGFKYNGNNYYYHKDIFGTIVVAIFCPVVIPILGVALGV